jgi:nucleoside-diphosphate-sugar epimerase
MKIFLAGAAGVVGRPLCVLLRRAGHDVVGTTRSETNAAALRALGVTPAIVNVYDAEALTQAMAAARPDVVIHQITDLPDTLDPDAPASVFDENARVRVEGTRNLMAAAAACGVKRVIAQSIAFVYAPKDGLHVESDPLLGEGPYAKTVEGVIALESGVQAVPGIEGVVLRYGGFYGPGTWFDAPTGPCPVHVEAAAQAALLALTRGAPGIYNVAEDGGSVSNEKAKRDLGFDAGFRIVP